MDRPADVFQEMLRQELSAFRPVVKRAEVLGCLEEYWNEAQNQSVPMRWPADQRAARAVWAGIGFLIFGRLDHLKDTLQTIVAFPQSANYSTCRYYVPAIEKLLPLPGHLRLADNPAAVLDWFQSHADQIQWNEELGQFTYVDSEVHLN